MVRHSTDNISDIAPFLVYNQHNDTLQSSSYPPTASITEPHSQNKEAEDCKIFYSLTFSASRTIISVLQKPLKDLFLHSFLEEYPPKRSTYWNPSMQSNKKSTGIWYCCWIQQSSKNIEKGEKLLRNIRRRPRHVGNQQKRWTNPPPVRGWVARHKWWIQHCRWRNVLYVLWLAFKKKFKTVQLLYLWTGENVTFVFFIYIKLSTMSKIHKMIYKFKAEQHGPPNRKR